MSREHPEPTGQLPEALEQGLRDFLDVQRVEAGLARASLAAYASDLRGVGAWLVQSRGADLTWDGLDEEAILGWLEASKALGHAPATRSRGLVSLRLFCRFRVQEGLTRRDPSARLPTPRLARLLPHTLAAVEVERLLEAAGGDDWRSQRDRALLELLYACGARVSEAVGLKVDDLEPELRVVRLFGKGSKARLVPMGAAAREHLERWVHGGRRELIAPRAARPARRCRCARCSCHAPVAPWTGPTHGGACARSPRGPACASSCLPTGYDTRSRRT